MQKKMEEILQKFCFYPGGLRDKMIKNGSKRVMELGTTLSGKKVCFLWERHVRHDRYSE